MEQQRREDAKTEEKYPHARLFAEVVFEKGDCGHALLCYQTAKLWALFSGLTSHDKVAGIIGSPRYKGQASGNSCVPADWDVNDPEWSLSIELYAEKDDPTDWLKELKLTPPEGAKIERR